MIYIKGFTTSEHLSADTCPQCCPKHNDSEALSSEDPVQTDPSVLILCTSQICFAVENLSNSLTMTGQKMMETPLPVL